MSVTVATVIHSSCMPVALNSIIVVSSAILAYMIGILCIYFVYWVHTMVVHVSCGALYNILLCFIFCIPAFYIKAIYTLNSEILWAVSFYSSSSVPLWYCKYWTRPLDVLPAKVTDLSITDINHKLQRFCTSLYWVWKEVQALLVNNTNYILESWK